MQVGVLKRIIKINNKMKRLIHIATLLFLAQISFAQTYYISPAGSDTTGDGSVGNPWATLYKASSTVTIPGSTIFVKAGTYNETQQSILNLGVNLDGISGLSIINNTATYALTISSANEGTLGNQFIRNITLTGSDTVGVYGISVLGVSNVSVYNCKIMNFLLQGINFVGGTNGYSIPPVIPATGNQFYNDTIINCTERAAAGGGNGLICFGGQNGLLIHDCYFNQTQRNPGYNGNIVGGVQGYDANVKYYNNTSVKPNREIGWNFHIEHWYSLGGMEVYNCQFLGGGLCIDIGGATNVKGSSTYSWYIHNNTFALTAQDTVVTGAVQSLGVDVEGATSNVFIEQNNFNNLDEGVQITGMTTTLQDSIFINRNLFDNMGGYDPSNENFTIGFINSAGQTIRDVFIDNNTMTSGSPFAVRSAISFKPYGTVSNIHLRNNIITNSYPYGYLAFWSYSVGVTDRIFSQNNLLYGNSGSNLPVYMTTSTVTNFFNKGNIIANPLLNSDLSLQAGSPAIGAAISLGYGPDLGAVPFSVPQQIWPHHTKRKFSNQ